MSEQPPQAPGRRAAVLTLAVALISVATGLGQTVLSAPRSLSAEAWGFLLVGRYGEGSYLTSLVDHWEKNDVDRMAIRELRAQGLVTIAPDPGDERYPYMARLTRAGSAVYADALRVVKTRMPALSDAALQYFFYSHGHYTYLSADWKMKDTSAAAIRELVGKKLVALLPSGNPKYAYKAELTDYGRDVYSSALRSLASPH